MWAAFLLFANGLYDVFCALSIVSLDNVASRLHVEMFTEPEDVPHRILAYWIFTYGLIRLYSGLFGEFALGALTYLIEASCLEFELHVGRNMNALKVHPVALLCLVFAFLLVQKELPIDLSGVGFHIF